MDSTDLAREIVDAVVDKLGENVLLLDIRPVSIIADYFVICSANSNRQMNAIVEDLRLALKREHNMFPWNIEGSADGGWILMDYGDVVIHIFEPETREYYNLEEMWSEAPVVVHFQ